ncbi:MAG: hypothetical protein RIM84_05285 [Alphaproteobacteria bacterium]
MESLSRWWLVASVPALLAAASLLLYAIRRTVVSWRANKLHTLPLTAEQVVDLAETGPMVLHAHGPRFSMTFMGLDYEIRRVEDDAEVPLGRAWFAFRTNGFGKARVPLRRFVVDRPGPHRLLVRHLTPDREIEDRELWITRGDGPRMALRVAGIIVGGWLTIGALILTILALVEAPIT